MCNITAREKARTNKRSGAMDSYQKQCAALVDECQLNGIIPQSEEDDESSFVCDFVSVEDVAWLQQGDSVTLISENELYEYSAQIGRLRKKGSRLASSISTFKRYFEERLVRMETQVHLTETSLANIRTNLENVSANVKKARHFVELLERGNCTN